MAHRIWPLQSEFLRNIKESLKPDAVTIKHDATNILENSIGSILNFILKFFAEKKFFYLADKK